MNVSFLALIRWRRVLPITLLLVLALAALPQFVNAYALHATSTRALRLEYDNVPERVVEIPAPPEGSSP